MRNIGTVRSHLPDSATAQLVHALITSRLDYCNSLLHGIPKYKTDRLQCVHNIAARIVARCPKFTNIAPVLYELHWLPIYKRIVFKLLLLVYRSVNQLAPLYLCELDKTLSRRFQCGMIYAQLRNTYSIYLGQDQCHSGIDLSGLLVQLSGMSYPFMSSRQTSLRHLAG